MARLHEIEFVLKDLSQQPTHQITHIGGRLSNGSPWKITAKEAMETIRDEGPRYFIRVNGDKAETLVLCHHPLYGMFLTISPDQRIPATLLKMPEVIPELV